MRLLNGVSFRGEARICVMSDYEGVTFAQKQVKGEEIAVEGTKEMMKAPRIMVKK